MSPRRFAHAGAALLLGCAVATSASAQRETATDAGAQQDAATTTPAQLPDWSGQWENVGATPSPDGGFYESLEEVLTKLEWSPPNKPEAQAAVDKVAAVQRKAIEAMRQGKDPGGAVRACTFGYPTIMLESPLMFEILTTPKETALIFSSREIRHVYTDGREHPGKDDIWPTPWGDSIGHWEGDTLVIDTIAVKPAFPGRQSTAVMAFGGIEEAQTIAFLSPDARFVERLRMIDKDHLENQITIIDPANLTEPWHLTRTYRRVAQIHRMVYEDCEGEERNPIVDGKFTLAPPATR
jgi:hypothetical protein